MTENQKLILSINAGSSSVKLSLYKYIPSSSSENPTLLLEASFSNLTSPSVLFTYKRVSSLSAPSNVEQETLEHYEDHEDAFVYFLRYLRLDNSFAGVNAVDDIAFACHRIVHGGDYRDSMLLESGTLKHLEELAGLAPLHNAPALSIVRTTFSHLPKTKNIAYFDTTFHTLSIPPHISTYPLNPTLASQKSIRKYGFHGISYSFIVKEVAHYLGKELNELNIIALHLGSGASAVAIRGGESLDTSMGLTPLEGLPGATRSGTVDPSLVFHYTSEARKLSHSSTKYMHIHHAEEILNKSSGWSSITGTTNFQKITSDTGSSPECKLAFDLFTDRIQNYIGSYYVKLRGQVDALVFSGGIGEKSPELRKAVVDGVECLGFGIEKRANESVDMKEGVVVGIGGERVGGWGAPKVLVVRTDEQMEMARDCCKDGRFLGAGER